MRNRIHVLWLGLCLVIASSARAQTDEVLLDGFVGNAGFTNNYFWRGITQTNDGPAVSGGLDYGYQFIRPFGLYVGLWFSNVDFRSSDLKLEDLPIENEPNPQYELDLYGGISGTAFNFDLGYDVGYIYYAYPDDNAKIDFGEIYAGLSWAWLSGYVYKIVNNESDAPSHNAWYYQGNLDIPLKGDVFVNLVLARYTGSGAVTLGGDQYWYYGVAISKDEFSLGIVETDLSSDKGNDDLNFQVIWTKEFDL